MGQSRSPIASHLAVCLAAFAVLASGGPIESHDTKFWRPLTPFSGFTPVVRVTRQYRDSFIPLGSSIPLQNERPTIRTLRPTRQEYEQPAIREVEPLVIRPLERAPKPIRPDNYQEQRSNPEIMFPVTYSEPNKRPLPASAYPKETPVPTGGQEAAREEIAYRALDEASRAPVPSTSDAGNSLSRRTYQPQPSRTLFDSSSSTFARRIFGAPPSPIDLGFPAISSTQDNWNFDVNWLEFGRRRRRRAADPADRKEQRTKTPDNLAVESRRPRVEQRVPAPASRRVPAESRAEARSVRPPVRPSESRSSPVQKRPIEIGAAERRERERPRIPPPQRVPERRESRPEPRPQLRPESRRPQQANRTPERREREGSPEAKRSKPSHKDDKQEYDGPYIYTQLFGPPYEVGYIRSPVPSKHVYEDYLQFVRSWSSASRDAVDDMVRKNPALGDQYKDNKYLPSGPANNKDYKDDGYSGGKDSASKDDGYDSKPAYKDESYDSKPAYKDESYDSKPSTYKDDSYDSKPSTYKDDSYDSKPSTYKDDSYDSKPSTYKDDSYDSKPSTYKDEPYGPAKPSSYKDDSYDAKPAYKDDPYDSKPAYKDDSYDSKPAGGYKDDSYDSKPAYKDESYDSKPGKDYKDDGYKSTANYHSPAPGYTAPADEFLPGNKPYQSGSGYESTTYRSSSGGAYDDGPAYDILKPFQKGKPTTASYSSGSSYETNTKSSYDSGSNYDSGYDAGKKYDSPTRPGTATSSYYETPTRYVEPPPYGSKDSYKSDGYKSDYDAPTATYIPPTKGKNDYKDSSYEDKDYKDSSYSSDGYSSGGNKYDVDLSSSSYQKIEQSYDSPKDSYSSSPAYDAKDDGYGKDQYSSSGKDQYSSSGNKDAYAGDSYDDKKSADYSSTSGAAASGKKKHYPVIIGRYQVTDSTAFLPKKVGGEKGGSSYSGGAVGSQVHGANGEEYVVYYLPYGQPLPVPVRRRRSADPGIVGYKSLADRPVRRIKARNLEVLTLAEAQEVLQNPVPLVYETLAAIQDVKADQVAVEEVVVDDKPVTLVSLDGLDEQADNLAAELSSTDLPEVEQTESGSDSDEAIESSATVETPEDDQVQEDGQSVTPSIAEVSGSPDLADAPALDKDEEQNNVDTEPQLEHAVGEIIIVADVEVPEDGETPLPAVDGDVSVLEFLAEANAGGHLKPVEVHEQHPAWETEKKVYSKKPAVESVAAVPGLTQKPVEYIKPPGITDKEARNWNGYSTWWTKLGNNVAKLYNYE